MVLKVGRGAAGFEPAFGIVSTYPHITQDAVLCSASHIPGYGPIRFHDWLSDAYRSSIVEEVQIFILLSEEQVYVSLVLFARFRDPSYPENLSEVRA